MIPASTRWTAEFVAEERSDSLAADYRALTAAQRDRIELWPRILTTRYVHRTAADLESGEARVQHRDRLGGVVEYRLAT